LNSCFNSFVEKAVILPENLHVETNLNLPISQNTCTYLGVYIGQEFGYTGRRHDVEDTGLMYFRRRFYSPELGRFIGRDPIGYHDGMSLYQAYFAVNGVDPSGLFKDCFKQLKALMKDLPPEIQKAAEEAVDAQEKWADAKSQCDKKKYKFKLACLRKNPGGLKCPKFRACMDKKHEDDEDCQKAKELSWNHIMKRTEQADKVAEVVVKSMKAIKSCGTLLDMMFPK
jgi:RHS repeat-associated protein